MRTKMLALSLLLFISADFQVSGQLNVISYNIRLNTSGDGGNAWPYRRENVIQLLRFHGADIFCLQEALHEQVVAIDSAFDEFDFAGVGRDDGAEKGEYSPVFYNTNRLKSKESGNFWLSETPGIPALGWDAACIRICSWVVLEEIATGEELVVFNTHFDHIGVVARKNAADLIIEKTGTLAINRPFILCGDFNLPPSSEPIKKLSSVLHDSYSITELPPYGARGTWSGFSYDDKAGDRIDYIFVSEGIKVRRYAALTDSRDRKFFSDHLPVFVELNFPGRLQ